MVLSTTSPLSLTDRRCIVPRWLISWTSARPASSWISRKAACSSDSPGSTWPLGSTHTLVLFLCCASAILSVLPMSRRMIAPADTAVFCTILCSQGRPLWNDTCLHCLHWGHLSPLSPMSLCSKNLPVKVGIPPLLDVLVGRQGEKFGELVVRDDLVEQLTSQSKLARSKLLLAKSSLDLR